MPVGHSRQASEHVAEIGERVQPASSAVFDDRINDGAALAGIGIADEEPFFLADGGGANGIFHQIVVYLDAAIFQKDFQRRPLA